MAKTELLEESTTGSIINAFFEVYNEMGYGFAEFLYGLALERELIARRHRVGREVSVRVPYKGEFLGFQRLDMIVDDKIVVEIKTGSALPPTAERQLRNYLKATTLEVGLLLYFGPVPKIFRQVSMNPPEKVI